MLNKTVISIFIIIINTFLCFNISADEQFTFDVTELEISDNGNIIRGFNRGKILSDSGLEIEADTFSYNKITNILNVSGNVKAEDKISNFIINSKDIIYLINKNEIISKNGSKIIDSTGRTISADKILYNTIKNTFNANGNVRIEDEIENFIIKAQNITYLKNQNIIKSKGKTNFLVGSRFDIKSKDIEISNSNKIISSRKSAIIKDNKYKTLYELSRFNIDIANEILKGENIIVNTNFDIPLNDKFYFKSGVFDLKKQSFATQNIDLRFRKDLLGNKENDPRIKGVSSTRKNGVTTFNKGIFTSCKINDNCPPWSIQAKKIEYDENKKQINYENALVKIYDVPVFYFPKFFHPGPTVKRQSGLLSPRMNNSQTLGSSIQIPYYIALSENKDFTFTPTIFDKNIYKFQNEYRQKNKYSSFIADFSYTEGYQSIKSKDKNSITHLFAKYDTKLNFDKFTDSDFNISIQKVSNDTYLKVFDQDIVESKIKPQNFDVLESEIKLKLNHEKYELETGFISYEDLQKTNNDRYELVLPYYNFSKGLTSDQSIGLLNFTSLGDNTLKDTNTLRSRIINDLDFKSLDFINEKGIKSNVNFQIKNLISSYKNYDEYRSNLNSKLMGIIELQTSYPLIKTSKQFINYFDPKISLRVNPSTMTNSSDEERTINNNNIFDINRLGLIDTLESGNNLTLGIEFKKEKLNDNSKYFELKLGTVLRTEDNNNIPTNSAITQERSNIFGNIINNLNENINLDYEFSINNDLDKINYHSLSTEFSKNEFKTRFNFIEENGVVGNTNIIENKTSYNFDKSNSLIFETRQNRELDMAEYYNLIYEYKNDCLVAGIKYNKTYYSDRDLRPSEELMFKLTLIPITSGEQTISK
ncbi:LPS-assembly protein LptD [Candidatus Pelagibacter bacterium nBUS_36]|uniref:LPS-assembly protein LptD n=1 Tax=Candidatus Pelagibacter bacterium nBUS_36 TaxID=3374194 RepID=UPI003EBD4A8D